MTIYPHLEPLITAITNGLSLTYPVKAYAGLEQITIQGTPSVYLVPEALTVLRTINDVRTITAFLMSQEWLIVTVLRDAGDQKVTSHLISQLGEIQAKIVNLLMRDVLLEGGPIRILDFPESTSIEGGSIAGKIRISTQFVFNSE